MDPQKPVMDYLLIVFLKRVMVYIPTLSYCDNS